MYRSKNAFTTNLRHFLAVQNVIVRLLIMEVTVLNNNVLTEDEINGSNQLLR